MALSTGNLLNVKPILVREFCTMWLSIHLNGRATTFHLGYRAKSRHILNEPEPSQPRPIIMSGHARIMA